MQTILSLSENTAIKLTTSRYYTPKDRSIQATGIKPDVVVEDSPDGSWSHIREADLIGHLDNNQTQANEAKTEDSNKTVTRPTKSSNSASWKTTTNCVRRCV